MGVAEGRYREAGGALEEYAGALDRAQSDSLNALAAAKPAQADAMEARTRAERDIAAERAIEIINGACGDGLADSWWDDWGRAITQWIAKICEIVSGIAGVLALLVSWVPIVGPWPERAARGPPPVGCAAWEGCGAWPPGTARGRPPASRARPAPCAPPPTICATTRRECSPPPSPPSSSRAAGAPTCPRASTRDAARTKAPPPRAYEEQITGYPVEYSIYVEGDLAKVEFDGFRDGVLLDAKGPRTYVIIGHEWGTKALEKMQTQMDRQVDALARGGLDIPIHWHFAEKGAMEIAAKLNVPPAITLFYTPPK